jgi:DNA polymerase-3 subunit beta
MNEEFKVKRDVLYSAIEKIIISAKNKMVGGGELLHFFYIRIDGRGDSIQLSAYNSIRRIEIITKEVTPHRPFCVGVSGNLLYLILKELPQSELTIDISGGGFKLRNDNSNFSMDTLSADRFPSAEDSGRDDWRPFSYDEFFSAVDKVSYCTSNNDNTPPHTRAICVSESGFMCTNGFRMSVYPNRCLKVEEPIMLPPYVATVLRTVFKGEQEVGYYSYDESSLFLSRGGVYMAIRLMAGSVPNFARAIPQGPCTPCTVSRPILKSALKRTEIIIKEEKKAAFVTLTFSPNGLLATSNRGASSAKEYIPMEYSGPSVHMKLNLEYILSTTRALQDDEVVMELRGPQMGLVLTDKEGEHKNVIMPVIEQA